MKLAFCTISTQSHLFKVKALYQSVSETSNVDFFCLLTDSPKFKHKHESIVFNDLADLNKDDACVIVKKYKGDKLRWGLKPFFLKHLLQNGYDKVIYCDNDIFFYAKLDFLFEKLTNSDILLTPHFYKYNTTSEQNWLEANYSVGLFNAGFFGANKNAIDALSWWGKCCEYNIKKSFYRGLYDDQKYLDLMPIIFDNVEILKHKGCNVAGWNIENYHIEIVNKGLKINNYELVFVHYTPLTFRVFNNKKHLMYQSFKDYINTLKTHNAHYSIVKELSRTYKDYFFYFKFLIWKIVNFLERNHSK